MSGTQGQNGNRSFWTTMPGTITAIAALLTAIGGLIGGLYAVGWIGQKPSPSPSSTSGTVTQQGSAPPSSHGIQQAPPSTMDVNVTADPPQFPPGGKTTIFVEVLSAPLSPIKDAEVRIEVGDSLFTGTTNTHGYYAAEWTSPAPISGPLDYYVTVTVTKPGYKETSKRITIFIECHRWWCAIDRVGDRHGQSDGPVDGLLERSQLSRVWDGDAQPRMMLPARVLAVRPARSLRLHERVNIYERYPCHLNSACSCCRVADQYITGWSARTERSVLRSV